MMQVTTVYQNIERRVYALSEWDVKEACREYVLRSPVFAEHPDLDHVIRVDLLEDDNGTCLKGL